MRHPDAFALRELLGDGASVCRAALSGEHGVALPPLTDHHVHGHLVDLHAVAGGGIAAVLDLGGDPVSLFRHPATSIPRVSYAGAFLTAPGGYPVGRPWAPPVIVRQIVGPAALGVPGGAETAVDEQAEFGASVIKVSLNAAVGPVLDLDTLLAVVARAHERALPVVAHVEGDGMTRLAIDAGVDALAHTPFTEIVEPELVARAVEAGQRWISTLAIHGGSEADAQRASLNLRAFLDAGGRVLYGTDLGNGEQPLGVNPHELRALVTAGLSSAELLGALTDPWPAAEPPRGVATFVAGIPPTAPDEVPDWLAGARVVAEEELIHDDH